MITQEEMDKLYRDQQRKKKQDIADQAEQDNARLSYPKDYRGIRYYMTQYSTYIIPDIEGLEGLFTSPYFVRVAIDSFLVKKEGDS